MAHSDISAGHRVDALIRLDEAERSRLLSGAFRPGSRSVMFRSREVGQHEDGDRFGAVIEEVDEQADGLLRVHLWFWTTSPGST